MLEPDSSVTMKNYMNHYKNAHVQSMYNTRNISIHLTDITYYHISLLTQAVIIIKPNPLNLVVELHPEQILSIHLANIIHNKLVVEKISLQLGIFHSFSNRYSGSFNFFHNIRIGSSLANTLGRVESSWKLLNVLRLGSFVHATQSNIAQQQQTWPLSTSCRLAASQAS